MIRLILPPMMLGTVAPAQDIGPCRNIPYSQKNCVRVLACVGDQGVTFDGRARGWDTGTVSGAMSYGATCEGTWNADGPMGSGIAEMTCNDGTQVDVTYYSQDNVTGTTIGEGKDNKGRNVQVWTGENVLEFLTPQGAFGAALPCIQGDIPIS